MDWQTFWNEHPASASETDFLVQVGHTVGGQPYTPAQFAAMVESIRAGLDLRAEDILLDLCCGNGIITSELAQHCRQAAGVDFSETLIARAVQHNMRTNLSYHRADVRLVGGLGLGDLPPATRVLIYAALQHFEASDLTPLIEAILARSAPNVVILIGGTLDASRKHAFLDTPGKRQAYETYVREGRDRLGTWWDPATIASAAQALGLSVDIDQTSPGRPGGHYRFDARLKR